MITNNPMQLKAIVKKKALESDISSQLVLQNYMLERFLERISLSRFRNNFILKGGLLIASLVGIDSRATMDMDTTITGFTLTHETLRAVCNEICCIEVDDNIVFSINRVTDIRDGDEYPGMRVSLTAGYGLLKVPLTMDVTTGDMVTPGAIVYEYPLLFDNRMITIQAYNLETIVSEKLETILSRNIANTRLRDFYDVYIIYHLHWESCRLDLLKRAFERTAKKRGSELLAVQYPTIIPTISQDTRMNEYWRRYQNSVSYAKEVSFADACAVVMIVMERLFPNAGT
jgi:predicted nucleotidyltransferase component of viral defense system